jgi:hypothetical protein
VSRPPANLLQPFHAERASWRTVIQLNVVQSIRLILDTMSDNQRGHSSRPDSEPEPPNFSLSQEHLRLKMRLCNFPSLLLMDLCLITFRSAPLAQVEESLIRKLDVLGTNPEPPRLKSLTNLPSRPRVQELCVYSSAWKGAMSRLLPTARRESFDSQVIDSDDPNDPSIVLHACAEDMMRLWNDPAIKTLLDTRKLRLEEVAGL